MSGSTAPRRFPFYVLSGALLLWGQLTEQLVWAAPLALAVELPRLMPFRYRLSARDFTRASDLCIVLLLGIVANLYLSILFEPFVIAVLRLLPLILAPLIVAYRLSTAEDVALVDLFPFLRGRRSGRPGAAPLTFSPEWLYLGVCLMAAGTSHERSEIYLPALGLLLGAALFASRRTRPNILAFLLLFGVSLGLGSYLSVHIDDIQARIRSRYASAGDDPFKSRTALGGLGELKLSDRVVMQVRVASGAPPRLLREASYDLFDGENWRATLARFEPASDRGNGTWLLDAARRPGPEAGAVTVYRSFYRSKGLLALPPGTAQVEGLVDARLEVNRLGAAQLFQVQPFLAYTARRALPGLPGLPDGPPREGDFHLPPLDAEFLRQRAGELGLDAMSPQAAARTLAAYFQREFRYTRVLPGTDPGATPLADFLTRTRSGHCEYFASAATLLLRAAGHPARYATGYALTEYDPDAKRYLVRRRHAHAWVLVYEAEVPGGGGWLDTDVTPASWTAIEEAGRGGLLTRLADLRSQAAFFLARLRWLDEEEATRRMLSYALIPLLGFLLWRLRGKMDLTRVLVRGGGAKERQIGADSPYYALAEALVRRGAPRRGEGQTWREWVGTLPEALPGRTADAAYARLVRLVRAGLAAHYSLRFAPGRDPAARQADREALEALLTQARTPERAEAPHDPGPLDSDSRTG